ncbi:hypothetical protein [Diaminobutyricimonas sp. TR449]|uniref:hypothetical protein n=1 Tax=Diaminobutyricimonas sp. TR449 TaxID=2708076 RepID=UPI001422E838|nr:hypothetical protein [Diaminobutyricimonas sp. TR449]
MPYPTQADILAATDVLPWIDEHILRLDPYAFPPGTYWKFVAKVAEELDVDPNGVFCIGSGAIGLSMNPKKVQGKNLKPFGPDSDLDLAIVSEVHFETAWRDLRRAAQPSRTAIDEVVRSNLSWQKGRLFDGAIIASKLLPSLSFGSEWLPASVRVSQLAAQILDREIDVNLWIYRDYWSVRNYVSRGFIESRKKIFNEL